MTTDTTTAARALQPQLFGEPTYAQMLNVAQAAPLDEKIDNAVALLRTWEKLALSKSPDGYYVCDSYGKDSDCIVHLAKLAGVAHKCHHNVTSIDPPELQRFGMRERSGTIRHRQSTALLPRLVARSNGPPTRLSRWCCAEYKEQGGSGMIKVIGVRAAESQNRSVMWREFSAHNNGVCAFVCPILYWTTKDVWEFHRRYSLPHCELYDQGFKRLGCVGCPLGGPASQRREFARWPLYARNWHRTVLAYADKWHGVPLLRPRFVLCADASGPKGEACYVKRNKKTGLEERGYDTWRRWFEDLYDKGGAEAIWQWWISGKGQDDKPAECQYGEMFAGSEKWGEQDDE